MGFIDRKESHILSIFLGGIALHQTISFVSSHGRMIEPAQRSSLWRFPQYSGAVVNYDDNQLWCGGFQVQWGVNGGKCGVCGDPYQGPGLNEAGNTYGLGIIARTYTPGQAITVKIELTANHKGYFEYRLCVHNNPTVIATDDCFTNLLYIVESANTKYPITSGDGTGIFIMTVQLPAGVTCSQCIIRWKYNTGNSWGCDSSGNCGMGLGAQEQFKNCADIAIVGSPATSSTPPGTSTTTTTTAPSSTTTTTTAPSTSTPMTTTASQSTTTTTISSTTTTVPPITTTTATATTTGSISTTHESTSAEQTTTTNNNGGTTSSAEDCPHNLVCISVPPYDTVSGMTDWCNTNCNWHVPYCPETHCSCECPP